MNWLIVGKDAKAWRDKIKSVPKGMELPDIHVEGTFEESNAFLNTSMEMLREFDAGLIVEEKEMHYDLCVKLLKNGKHVLCDKPLCFEQSQLDELIKLATDNQKVIAQISLNRFNAALVANAKSVMKAKKLQFNRTVFVEGGTTPSLEELKDIFLDTILDDIDTFLFFFFQIPVKFDFKLTDKKEAVKHEIVANDKHIDLSGVDGDIKSQMMFFQDGIKEQFAFIDGRDFLKIEMQLVSMLMENFEKEVAAKSKTGEGIIPLSFDVELDFNEPTTEEDNRT